MSGIENVDLDEWEGALGPQSEDDPAFYEIKLKNESVRLTGPSPGMSFEYSRGDFETLVENGEWVLADDDWENQVFRTPNGVKPH